MALIKCPECGKEQSSFAKVCSYCSFPLEEYGMNPDDFTWEKEHESTEENADFVSENEIEQAQAENVICETISDDEIANDDFNECESIDGVDYLNDGSTEYEHNDSEKVNDYYTTPTINKQHTNLFIEMGLFHKIIDWIISFLVIFSAAALLAAGTTVVGILWVIAGFSILPVRTILSLWDGILRGKKKWRRPVIIVLFIFFSIFFA